jgi:transcription antitermination factor NusB
MSRRKAREYALQILFQLDLNSSELTDEIWNEFWASTNEGKDIQKFSRSLAQGTLEHIDTLDEIITKAADHWSLDRMAVVDRNILRTAAYELFYRDDIPPAVTINEAVEISKKYSAEDSAPFINGILDKIYKQKTRS